MRVYTSAPVPGANGVALDDLRDVASWTDRLGLRGMLLYCDSSSLDPWLAAQYLIERTEHLVPIVALQPAYEHPLRAARAAFSIARIHRRGVDMNLVSGGFPLDLVRLADPLDHDERYERLSAFGRALNLLMTGEEVRDVGSPFNMRGMRLAERVPEELLPVVYVAGSSAAAARSAATLGSPRLLYPLPAHDLSWLDLQAGTGTNGGFGVRLGIITRTDSVEAWRVAQLLFPPDKRGERLHRLASATVESTWHRELSEVAATPDGLSGETYWLRPFLTYKRLCPYLVGSHSEVADYLAVYTGLGMDTLLLDTPESEDDLRNAMAAISLAGAVGNGTPC